MKRLKARCSAFPHVLPPPISKCTIIRHTLVPNGGATVYLDAKRGGHRHLTGDRPLSQTSYVRMSLLAHVGSTNSGLLAVDRVEQALAQTDVLGRDLDQLVVLDVLESLFQRESTRRGKLNGLVCGR